MGGPRGKGSTSVSKGPKPPIQLGIAIAEKQSKRSKKGPFSLSIGPPGSHPGNEINGVRRGRSLPVPPVSPAKSESSQVNQRAETRFEPRWDANRAEPVPQSEPGLERVQFCTEPRRAEPELNYRHGANPRVGPSPNKTERNYEPSPKPRPSLASSRAPSSEGNL